jgi:hypothetical protein
LADDPGAGKTIMAGLYIRELIMRADARRILMRRMVKEELLKFDGTPLFPERKAYSVNYTLSKIEAALYESVTHYVQAEMGKADALQGPRKGSVGFALTALQRRLASSPEAIYRHISFDFVREKLKDSETISIGRRENGVGSVRRNRSAPPDTIGRLRSMFTNRHDNGRASG